MVDTIIQKINTALVIGFTTFALWVLGVSYYHVFTG